MPLFGSLSTNPTPATTGSIFGTPTSVTATAPSISTPAAPNTAAENSTANTTSTAPKLSSFGALPEPAKPNFGTMFADAAKNLKSNAPTTTTAAGGGGLFGAAPAASSAPTTSLFGTPASTTAQAGSSLFGSTTTAAPAASTTSLFGGLKPATTTATTTAAAPSLFGSTATNSLQPSSVPQGSLFQSLNAGQPAPNASTQAPVQGSAQTAYFESLLEKNKKRQRDGEVDTNDVPKLQFGLGDLSRRVRELGSSNYTIGLGQADTKAHYLLAASGVNPQRTLRELDAFNAQVGAQPVSSVVPDWEPDSHKYVEQLQSQMTLKMINEGIERANRRFDAFLQEHVDMNWAEQRRKVYEHFGLTPRNTNSDRGNTGASISDKGAFSRTRNIRAGRPDSPAKSVNSRSVFGQSSMQKSVIGSPAVGQGNIQIFGNGSDKTSAAPAPHEDRFIREKESKFSDKVQKLNESRLEESFYPLFREFLEVENAPGSDAPSEVLLAYKSLMEIVEEDTEISFKPRKFKDEYLDDNVNSERSVKCRQRILKGSRSVLENQFFEELVTAITKNTKEAQVGGVPTRLHKVKAYVRVRAARKDLVLDGFTLQQIGDDYCWALLFYLLRCGFADEAAQYVLENRNAFNAIDRMFATYITQYSSSPDRRLAPQFQSKLNNEYIQRTRLGPDGQTDPYRLACYKVIGRCEINKKSFDNIPSDVKDWMWLQFCLTREANRVEELATDVYSLSDLQADIHDIGQKHFQRGSDTGVGYGTFFLLQILGGLFENAVDFLYKHNYVSAVHFAVALDFYGLLRVSDFNASEADLLSHTTRGQPQIDFGRMIGYYTRDFRASNVVVATDYLAFIYLNADLGGELGRSYSGLCHEALRELVLETREFATLLGDINASNGQRIKGAIELRLPLIGLTDKQDYLRTVTIQAARVADENGRTTDAVLLYHLAEDYNSVISILNRALSDSIALSDEDAFSNQQTRLEPLKPRDQSQNQDQAQSSLSLVSVDDPFILARHFIGLYNPNAMYYERITQSNRDVCGLLMRVQEAKDLMLSSKWGAALQQLSDLNVVPLAARGQIPAIRHSAQNLARLPHTVARLIGPLLLWSIRCIGEQRKILLNGNGAANGNAAGVYETATRDELRDQLRLQAQDLMVFAGLVKLRLSQGVLERIMSGCSEVGVY